MIRILLDENVPIDLKKILSKAGYSVEHVINKCKGYKDEQVMEYALRNKQIIISQDSDFTNMQNKHHFGILKVEASMIFNTEPMFQLLKEIKNMVTEDQYYELTKKGAFKNIKKYTKKHHEFKQYYRVPIPLEYFQK